MGIGINANTDLSGLPEGISREAIAVKNILNHEVDLEVLLATACTEVLDRISRLATQEGRSKTIADYKRHCLTLNSQVIVYLDKGKVSGRAFDITGEGALWSPRQRNFNAYDRRCNPFKKKVIQCA